MPLKQRLYTIKKRVGVSFSPSPAQPKSLPSTPSRNIKPYLALQGIVCYAVFCHLRFGFVESFGFSAYLLSALRTSSFNIPCSIPKVRQWRIRYSLFLGHPPWSLPKSLSPGATPRTRSRGVQASLFLCRVSSVILNPASSFVA